jgi:prepilin-type N-terminal cleavage/methylation domain-containing protein
MKRKLQTSHGFSLFEILVAIIILSLVITVLSSSTAASLRIYRESTALSEATILSSTLFEAISDELRFATDVTTTATGALHTFTSTNYGVNASFSNDEANGQIKIAGADLIGKLAYTSLHATASITYESSSFHVVIEITDPNQDDAVCSNIAFDIQQLNP